MDTIYVIMHSFQDWHDGDWHTDLYCNSYYLTEEAAEKAKARLVSEYEEDWDSLYVKRLFKGE